MGTTREYVESFVDDLNKKVGQDLYKLEAFAPSYYNLQKKLGGSCVSTAHTGTLREVLACVKGMLIILSDNSTEDNQ